MKFLEKITKGESYIATIAKWIGYIAAIILAIGWISSFFNCGNSGLFALLRNNLSIIWRVAVSALVITLFIWITILHNRYTRGFTDKFKNDLQSNWDFKGDWRLAEKRTLQVTESTDGGITKIGAQWENYQFTFKAKIINKCIGVIVRAQDLNNYYMFQINQNKIVPHRRAAVPTIDQSEGDQQNNTISFKVGWQRFPETPINPELNDWFKVKIIVKGQSYWIYINGELALQEESFLKIPNGKVGFRNSGDEKALIKDVKISLR